MNNLFKVEVLLLLLILEKKRERKIIFNLIFKIQKQNIKNKLNANNKYCNNTIVKIQFFTYFLLFYFIFINLFY